MTTPNTTTGAQSNPEIDYPLSYVNCYLMHELTMKHFEQIVRGKKSDEILALVKPLDRGPLSQKGPFDPLITGDFLGRLPRRWAPRWEAKNDAITDEVLHAALDGFIKSYSERWWKEWLERALSLLAGARGWNRRKKGQLVSSASDFYTHEDVYVKEEEIYAPRLKELYRMMMGLITSHLDDSWINHSSHARGQIALLVYAFVTYSEWDEDPANYGITPSLIPLLRTEDYVDELDIRRVEIGKFSSRIEYLEWKMASADWPFRDEHKEGKEGTCWIKPSELVGVTIGEVIQHLISRRVSVKRQLEEARQWETAA